MEKTYIDHPITHNTLCRSLPASIHVAVRYFDLLLAGMSVLWPLNPLSLVHVRFAQWFSA